MSSNTNPLRRRLDAALATGEVTAVQADQLTERLLPLHVRGHKDRCAACLETWPCSTARLVLRANTSSSDLGWHDVIPAILDAHQPDNWRVHSCTNCLQLWPCDTVRVIAQVLGEQWNWEPPEETDDAQGHVLGVVTN